MIPLDRTFWTDLDNDLASLTPLVEKIIARGDWTASDLYTSPDGLALIEATAVIFANHDQPSQDRSLPPSVSESLPPSDSESQPAPAEPPEVLGGLADALTALITIRSRIATGHPRTGSEAAALQHELASATEVLRLITRDTRTQDLDPDPDPATPKSGDPTATTSSSTQE